MASGVVRGVLTQHSAADDAARFTHVRYPASADLAPYVEHYWSVSWDLRGLAPQRIETLPHPSVHMTFDRAGASGITGVTRGKFTRVLEGKSGVFGVKFRPGGFHPFAGVALTALADRTVALTEAFGAAGAELHVTMSAEQHDAGRVRVAEAFLRARDPQPDANVQRVAGMVYSIAREPGFLKVDDLVERYGMSKRTLQRLFAKYVGVTPKWVIQRYRLHEAAAQLVSDTAVSHAMLAASLGYSDQAHFVKDFKAVVGMPPAAYAHSQRKTRDDSAV